MVQTNHDHYNLHHACTDDYEHCPNDNHCCTYDRTNDHDYRAHHNNHSALELLSDGDRPGIDPDGG